MSWATLITIGTPLIKLCVNFFGEEVLAKFIAMVRVWFRRCVQPTLVAKCDAFYDQMNADWESGKWDRQHPGPRPPAPPAP